MLLNVVCALFFQNKALTKNVHGQNTVPVEGSVSQRMDDRHKMVEQEEIQTPKASRFIHRLGHIKNWNYNLPSSVSCIYCSSLEASEVDPQWIKVSSPLSISLLSLGHGCSVPNKILWINNKRKKLCRWCSRGRAEQLPSSLMPQAGPSNCLPMWIQI